jgi:hypothetical protein
MRVNIAVAPDWVLAKYAKVLEDKLDYVRVTNDIDYEADINYYLSYALFNYKHRRDICFFTHFEPNDNLLIQKWQYAAKHTDVAVTMNELNMGLLQKAGVKDIRLIVPGVDTSFFKPEYVIGIVGRFYENGRKGEEALPIVLRKLEGVQFLISNGGVNDMREFYRKIDLLLILSHYEGGPITALEAMAMNVPVLASRVGFMENLKQFSYDKIDEAVELIKRLRAEKLQKWGFIDKNFNIKSWVEKHHRLFTEGGEIR